MTISIKEWAMTRVLVICMMYRNENIKLPPAKLIYFDSNLLWLRHHSLKNDRKIIARGFVNTNSLAFFNSA